MKRPRFTVYVYGLVWNGYIRYIGVARNIERRVRRHQRDTKAGSQLPVHRAFRLYGKPSVEVLVQCSCYDEAYAKEAELVAQYRRTETRPLLNVADGGRGGGGTRGRPLSEAHKKALSVANAGQGKGIPMPAETRKKISLTTKGRPGSRWSEQQRAKIVAALKGRKKAPMTEAAKQKLAQSQRVAWERRREAGKTQSNTRLTWDQVREIRATYVRGSSKQGLVMLGRRYGVSAWTISAVVNGQRWKEAA